MYLHLPINQTILFSGSDGWKGDWVKAYTSNGPTYECFYSAFLDGDDSEVGHQCTAL